MTGPVNTDIEQRFAVLQAEAMRRKLERFDARTLSWLVLVPEWTKDRACRLGLSADVSDLLAKLADQNLVEQRVMPDSEVTFWLRSHHRLIVADHVRQTAGDKVDAYLEALREAVATPDSAMNVWQEVDSLSRDLTGMQLVERVDKLVVDGHLTAATNLVVTARAIGDLLRGPLVDATQRAQWRLDRAYRNQDDSYHVRTYHRREDIEKALEDLLFSKSEWALHLLGDAGVGKTMLIRYLASGQFAAERSMTVFPVARADFDHLDPCYPASRPAELLRVLTDELTGFETTRVGHQNVRHLIDSVTELDEEFARDHSRQADKDALLEAALNSFARLAGALPGPVVLILDTCEELAKLYAPGAEAPAIDHTFDVLERLHAAVPHIRVLLAGRRWLVPAPDPGTRAAGPRLTPKPYLKVVDARGFTTREAISYVGVRLGESTPFLDVLLARTSTTSVDGSRHNPFELANLCTWVQNDPDLTVWKLQSAAGDPYVELRIVGRITEPNVRAALPAAAELGRFEQDLIKPSLLRANVNAADAFDGLAAQEWVNVVSLGPDGRPDTIEVDAHIAARLRDVLANDPLDRERLGQDAAELINQTQLTDLPAETVEAAIRLLPVEAASELWEKINARVVSSGEWGWAEQVAVRVAAWEQKRAGEHTILAAILATQASARTQLKGSGPGVESLWREVRRFRSAHVNPVIREQLEARATFGLAAAVDSEQQQFEAALRNEAPLGSLIAAVERGLTRDDLEDLEPSIFQRTIEALSQAEALDDYTSIAYTAMLTAIIDLRRGHLVAATHAADTAIGRAMLASRERSLRWADWSPPRALLNRCRLVRLIIALRGGGEVSVDECVLWRTEALSQADDLDKDRLISAAIRYELCYHGVDDLVDIPLVVTRDRSGRLSWLHDAVPPLVVQLAEAWGVAGKPDVAAELLRDQINRSVHRGDEPDMIEQCELGLLRLCRRYRTTEYAVSILDQLARRSDLIRYEGAWLMYMLYDTPLAGVDDEGLLAVRSRKPRDIADISANWPQTGLPERMPRFVCARIKLAAAEIDALRNPSRAGEVLLEVVGDLESCGGRVEAAQAAVLAVLANARVVNGSPPQVPGRLFELLSIFPGWAGRASIAQHLSNGEPAPLVMSKSPELKLPRRRISEVQRLRASFQAARASSYFFPMLVLGSSLTLLFGAVLLDFPSLVNGITFYIFLACLVTVLPLAIVIGLVFKTAEVKVEERRVSFKRLWAFVALETGRRNTRRDRVAKRFLRPRWSIEGRIDTVAARLPSFPKRLSMAGAIGLAIFVDVDTNLRNESWERVLSRISARYRASRVVWVRLVGSDLPMRPGVNWRAAGTMFLGPQHLAPRALGPADQMRILHFVGTPVNTAAGTRFRVRDAADRMTGTRRGAIGEDLLDLGDVTPAQTGLVVLQAEPVDTHPTELGDARAGFIDCGRLALSAGARMVLVIPPLPDDLAKSVINLIWSRVGHRTSRPYVITYLQLVASLKRKLAKNIDSRADLDFILMARVERARNREEK